MLSIKQGKPAYVISDIGIKYRFTSKNVCTLQRLYHSLASDIVHLHKESWISASLSGQGWGGHMKDVNILTDEHLLYLWFIFNDAYLWWCKLGDCFLCWFDSATACMEICAPWPVSFLLFMAAEWLSFAKEWGKTVHNLLIFSAIIILYCFYI